VACNGHRSNPWFLDSLRTLMELCQGLATNAFGTHLGYRLDLDLNLHWIAVAPEQDLSGLRSAQADVEAIEWSQRLALSRQFAALRSLLQPYWGFDQVQNPAEMSSIFRGSFSAPCAAVAAR